MTGFAAVALPLGGERVPFSLDRALEWSLLEPRPISESLGSTESRLDEWVGEELEEVLAGDGAPRRVCLVVPDRTRRAPAAIVTRAIARALAKRGVPLETLDVVAATGTHREGASATWRAEFSSAAGVPIRGHDDADAHRETGVTGRGTRVAIDPAYLDADLRITLSAPVFHYFAGFGGGPKMIFPGLADRAGTLQNHRLALGPLPPGGLEPAVAPGRIEGNPVAEDIREAARGAAPHWSLHALESAGGWRFVSQEAGQQAARAALLASGATGDARTFDVVVASAGGAPRDLDLLQSHKALRHAAAYARDGGSVVLLAEIPNGVGSESLERWLGIADRGELERTVRKRYDGNAQTAISLRDIDARVRVHWVGAKRPESLATSGWSAYETVDAAYRDALAHARATGRASRGAVLPAATSVVPEESAAGRAPRRAA